MMNNVLKLVNIHAGEGKKVFHFSVLGILLDAGFTMGFVGADALFLTNLGAGMLPYVYFILPFIMVIITPILTYSMDRLGMFFTNGAACTILVLGGVSSFLVLEAIDTFPIDPSWFYFIIKIYTSLWYFVLYSIYWNCVDSYFDIISAKRLFPFLAGIKSIGIMLGSYLVTLFMEFELNISILFLIWALLALLAFLPSIFLRRKYNPITEEKEADKITLFNQQRNLKQAFKTSRYIVFLTLTAFFGTFLAHVCEFQYMNIFEQRFNTEKELAQLFGHLHLFINLFNTLITFFFLNRIISILGIRNTALIQPITYSLSFTAYIAFHDFSELLFYAGLFGFFAFNSLHKTIEDNNWNFLINPIAQHNKASFRTFAEGVVDPFATAFAGLNLIILSNYFELNFLEISIFMTAASLTYLLVVFALRHYYVGEMIQNLRKEWLDFSRREEDIFSGLHSKQIDQLYNQFYQSTDDKLLTVVRILWYNDRAKAVNLLLNFIDREALSHIEIARPLLLEMLASKDNTIIRIIIEWMLNHKEDEKILILREISQFNLMQTEGLVNLLEDQNAQVRGAASNILWNHWNIAHGYYAMSTLHSLLSGDEASKIAGIQTLGLSGKNHYAPYLVQFLKDPSPKIQQAAKVAICNLVDHECIHLLDQVLVIIRESDSDIRTRAFHALMKMNDSNCIPPLLSMAPQFTPYERRQVNQVILSMELRGIPAIVQIVKDESYSYAARSIAARSLAHLALPQLQSLIPELISRELPQAYRMLYYHTILESKQTPTPGTQVLSRYYRDEQITTLEFVLELLTLGGQLPAHEMIAASLRSSNPKVRGNAIETIEQAVNWRLFKIILPLVDNRSLEDKIHFYQKQFKVKKVTLTEVIDHAWNSSMELEKAAAAQAKWNILNQENHEDLDSTEKENLYTSTMEQLCQNLSEQQKFVKETIFALLFHKSTNNSQDTIIERIHLFAQTHVFEEINTTEISTIADGAECIIFEEGEEIYRTGDAATCIYIIKKGAVELSNGSRSTYQRGRAFGIELFTGQSTRSHHAITKEQGQAYRIDNDYLIQCAKIKPHISIALLNKGLNL